MRQITKRAFMPKEKHVGIYVPTNEIISFTKEWSGHKFSNVECEALLQGNEIEFMAVTKMGKRYKAVGNLQRHVFNGNVFWGFELNNTSMPEEWSGHKFTDEEYRVLQSGGTIIIDDAISKKDGKIYSCELSFGEIDGKKRLVPFVI